MFHLPEAKSTSRELVDESDAASEGSNGEDELIRARLEAQMALSLGLTDMDVDKTTTAAVSTPAASSRRKGNQHRSPIAKAGASREVSSSDDDDDEEDEEEGGDGQDAVADADVDSADGREEYDFCLFGGSGAPTKVVLEDDSRPRGQGGLDAQRPRTFYVAGQPSEEERKRFAYAAVTGDQVLELSRQRGGGMEYPWRVTHSTTEVKKGADGQSKVLTVVKDDSSEKNKKRRPGKKTRVARRTKERAVKQKNEEAEKKAEEKEEHIKEKKKRMNRLKKLRKRAKNRELKGTAQGDGGDEAEEGDSSD